jgi:hypothetical protein
LNVFHRGVQTILRRQSFHFDDTGSDLAPHLNALRRMKARFQRVAISLRRAALVFPTQIRRLLPKPLCRFDFRSKVDVKFFALAFQFCGNWWRIFLPAQYLVVLYKQ